MMIADLHMHTTASDGVMSPEALVEYAVSRGVTHMAVTDHDTLAGADALRGRATPIPVIPGVELSMADMHGLHLLGYGMADAQELRDTLEKLARHRLTRAEQMVEKLDQLGFPIDYGALAAQAKGTVGRPHIAREMAKNGYVSNPEEAFRRYIGDNGPAYVAARRLTMAEAIPLLRRSGFVPVLAHPAEVTQHHLTLRTLLDKWAGLGLMGVEAYHPANQKMGCANIDRMARGMGLIVTGGSDYHMAGDRHGLPGCMACRWPNCEADVNRLLEAIHQL